MEVQRNVKIYDCCPDKKYPDLTFTIILRRKPLFYVVNLIIPCALISAMSIVEFILPCNSGEKVSLGITVLLSLTVFMLVVAENMPANSDNIPIIGWFYKQTPLRWSPSLMKRVHHWLRAFGSVTTRALFNCFISKMVVNDASCAINSHENV